MNTQEAQEFTDWHEHRMAELDYPPAIVQELREARIKFLAAGRVLQERRR